MNIEIMMLIWKNYRISICLPSYVLRMVSVPNLNIMSLAKILRVEPLPRKKFQLKLGARMNIS